jgi:hypothetical protein
VNLNPQEYACLLSISAQEEVSVAWIARRAITELIARRNIDPPSQMALPLSRQRLPKTSL